MSAIRSSEWGGDKILSLLLTSGLTLWYTFLLGAEDSVPERTQWTSASMCINVAQTNQGGVMRSRFTYESILSAVGRVLDESGVKSFAIREDDEGLLIEGKNSAGETQLQMRYRVEDVYDLLTRDEAVELPPVIVDAGATTLQHFLAEHRRELIGAAR
jgi:hypothetical protein